jgi:ATPase family associated with various cellular activities (AAA)
VQPEPFADNWAYLKAELIWLDRLLSMTVARQRQETKAVDRFARSGADRVTSHWWKGLVSLEGIASYDSPAETPARQAAPKASFQQQLEAKIQVSQAQGIALGLPMLRDRLHLSSFEKNLVLIALAPEISRRYSRLYAYLQDSDPSLGSAGWPSVDLLLRLLCRTDRDWQQGRQRLTIAAPLVQQGWVEIVGSPLLPFLNRSVKLCDRLTDYLLAELPNLDCFADRLALSGDDRVLLQVWQPAVDQSQLTWAKLVLPPPLLESVQHLGDSIRLAGSIESWGFGSESMARVALLAGPSGTGKTTAARTLAQSLALPLFSADLRSLHPAEFPALLWQIQQRSSQILLLKNAQLWLGRSSPLPPADLHALLHQRRLANCLTLFSLERSQSVQPSWRRQLDRILTFPLPSPSQRLKLWQAAFPTQIPLDPELDWQQLAQHLLSGGEIGAIACTAACLWHSESSGLPQQRLKLTHIQAALNQAGYAKQQKKTVES